MTAETFNEAMMARAIALAGSRLSDPRGRPFGAIVVFDGRVIGEACNEALFVHDPTAHAEVLAIRRACASVGSYRIDGAIMYSSCAPCPMCFAALHWAGIRRLFYACSTDVASQYGFSDKELYQAVCSQLQRTTLESSLVMELQGIVPFKMWEEGGRRRGDVAGFR
jgi:guanine deaminase